MLAYQQPMANKVKDINMAYDMVRSLWQNMSMARYCLPLAVELWHMHSQWQCRTIKISIKD